MMHALVNIIFQYVSRITDQFLQLVETKHNTLGHKPLLSPKIIHHFSLCESYEVIAFSLELLNRLNMQRFSLSLSGT